MQQGKPPFVMSESSDLGCFFSFVLIYFIGKCVLEDSARLLFCGMLFGGNSLFATANLSGLLLDLDSDAPGTCVLRGGLGDFSSFFRLII